MHRSFVKLTKLFRTGSTYISLNTNVYLFFSFSFSSRVWDTGSSGWYSGSSSSDSEGVGGNTWSNQPFHISRTHSLGTQSLLFNYKRVKPCILVEKTQEQFVSIRILIIKVFPLCISIHKA